MSGPRRGLPFARRVRLAPDRPQCGAAARVAVLLVLACCLAQPLAARAEGERASAGTRPTADVGRLAGEWLRADGGYLLELRDVKPDGALTALYFNPRPINVSRSEWRWMADRVQVFVELRDENYPGSTYLLLYAPEGDRLEGYYHHALSGQTLDVVFARAR